MGVFDNEIKSTKSQIDRNGSLVTWRSMVDTALPDNDKPWLPGDPSFTEYSVKIVFLPFTSGDRQTDKYALNSEVRTGLFKGLMAAVPFTPKARDFILDGTTEIKVTSVNKLAPNGQIILYYLELTS